MKQMLNLRRYGYLEIIGVFLTAVALVAGIVSCNGAPSKYELTMGVAPAGSGTATDLTDASPYESDTIVNIEATPAVGYQFVEWSAPAGIFGDSNAETTTFTMPAQNVTATAHFVGPLDHFKGYMVENATAPYTGEVVFLEDQFLSLNATVTSAELFCNPAEKLHNDVLTPVSNADHHLTVYGIDYEEEPEIRFVEVVNQFGTQQLTVSGPIGLAVPTQKEGHEPPVGLDHYLLYLVDNGPLVEAFFGLNDQFGDEPDVLLSQSCVLANPVRKTHEGQVTEIVNPEEHLVFYWIETVGEPFQTQVQVVNQFGEQTLDVSGPEFLAVPSTKTELPPPPVDHFQCYEAIDVEGSDPIGEYLLLEDQFGTVEVQLGSAEMFCNPVVKWHYDRRTPIWHPDHHLTLYSLTEVANPLWSVDVDNQFGVQQLLVGDPVLLAVPTQKLAPGDHGPPVGLDHFLLYEVIGGTPFNVDVHLFDQFDTYLDVSAMTPVFFANPVEKTHGDTVTPIENSEAHLVFYQISGEFSGAATVNNQFGIQDLLVGNQALLAVPSAKLSAEPVD